MSEMVVAVGLATHPWRVAENKPCPQSADLRAGSDSRQEHGLAADPEFERHRLVMAARHAAGSEEDVSIRWLCS